VNKVRAWGRRVIRTFVDLLRQGITPEKIAFTIALGLSLGVTPVLGSTSLLCTLAAIMFRLNLPAIQLINYLAYPLQIALLIPFLRLGAWIFRAPPVQLSVTQIFEMIRRDVLHTIVVYWTATWHALIAWLILATLSTGVIYVGLVPILRQAKKRRLSD
jgi:uncharacterized protein (DUF2062 family)